MIGSPPKAMGALTMTVNKEMMRKWKSNNDLPLDKVMRVSKKVHGCIANLITSLLKLACLVEDD